MSVVTPVNNIYAYDGTLAGVYAGSLVSAGLLNNLGAGGVGEFTENNGLLSPDDSAQALFSLNGGADEVLTYHGSGTVAMIGLLGIQIDSRPVAVFSAGGQIYLYAPQGLPLLSALSVSFDIDPNASFALPPTPSNGTVDGLDGSEAMGVGYTDLQGDQITDGDDIIVGNAGNDTIDAGGGHDLIYGGTGNDSLLGGAGNDILLGDGGNDVLSGGDDADSFFVTGGEGSDTIIGGEGGIDLDAVRFISPASGEGVHVVYTATEDGTYSFAGGGDGTFTQIEGVAGTEGDDTLDASATTGGTFLMGGGGDDTILGGSGGDSISGGAGRDTITAGDGSDTLDGGTGDDSLTGGGGDDIFVYLPGDGTDTITDFNAGITGALGDGDTTNNDFVDLSAYYDDLSALRADFDDDGILNQSNATDNGGTVDYTGNTRFTPGDGLVFQNVTRTAFSTDNTGVACFTSGTLILTPRGQVPVETLAAGDLVTTLDAGPLPLLWVGRTTRDADALHVDPKSRPIRLASSLTGARRDLLVSRQHAMLVGDRLVRALQMVKAGWPGARIDSGTAPVTYVHLLFDRHRLIVAEGVPSESMYPGPYALQALDAPALARIQRLFPGLTARASRPEIRAIYGPTVREVARLRDLAGPRSHILHRTQPTYSHMELL